MYVSVIFLNTSKTDCSLVGFPVVTLYNVKGFPMNHESQKNSPWILSRRVTVSSGGVAGFVIQFADGEVSGVDLEQALRRVEKRPLSIATEVRSGRTSLSWGHVNASEVAKGPTV